MKKEIKLNEELVKGINSGSIKAVDLVKFLITVEGIKYNKELALEDVSINMLVVDNHKVESAQIDSWENVIILTLGDKVKPDSPKELIEMKKVVINENEIYINSESTCFCQVKSRQVIDIKALTKKYNELVKLCKNKNIKVSYKNHFKKELAELKESYMQEVREWNNLFNTLASKWENKLNKGLYSGCVDDPEVNEMDKLDIKLQKMNVRSSAIFKVENIFNSINDKYENIINEYEEYSLVCL